MRLICLVVLVGVGCGSKSLSPKAAALRESDGTELTDCTFLGKFEGTAGDGDAHAETHAKNAAREKAAAAGATHIKWIVPCCTSVEAEAYKCDVPSD
jgi:hypothetical protein